MSTPSMAGSGITTPHAHDVLSGRGNKINQHSGNIYFRRIVATQKLQYVASRKEDKPLFARYVYNQIRARNPPGRFLKLDKACGKWVDIGETKSIVKARQALREKAPEIQKEMKEETKKRLLNSVSVATQQTQKSMLINQNFIKNNNNISTSLHSHSSSDGSNTDLSHGNASQNSTPSYHPSINTIPPPPLPIPSQTIYHPSNTTTTTYTAMPPIIQSTIQEQPSTLLYIDNMAKSIYNHPFSNVNTIHDTSTTTNTTTTTNTNTTTATGSTSNTTSGVTGADALKLVELLDSSTELFDILQDDDDDDEDNNDENQQEESFDPLPIGVTTNTTTTTRMSSMPRTTMKSELPISSLLESSSTGVNKISNHSHETSFNASDYFQEISTLPELPTFDNLPSTSSPPSSNDIHTTTSSGTTANYTNNPHFFDLKDGRRVSIRSSFLGPMTMYNYNYNNPNDGNGGGGGGIDTSSIDKLSSMSISSISGAGIGSSTTIKDTTIGGGNNINSSVHADRSSGSSGRSSGLTSHSSMSSGRVSLRRKHSLHLPGFDARLSSTMGLSHSISNSVRLSITGGGGGSGGGAGVGTGSGGHGGQVERDSLIGIVGGLDPAGIDTSTPTTTATTAVTAATAATPASPTNDESSSPRPSEMSHESFLLLGAYAKDLQEDRDSRIINPRLSSASELMEALDYYFDDCADDDDNDDDNVVVALNADTINDEEVKHDEESNDVEKVKMEIDTNVGIAEERELDMKLLSIQEHSSALDLDTPTKELSPITEPRTLLTAAASTTASKKRELSSSMYNTNRNKRNRPGSLADECILSMIVDSVVTDVVEQVVTPDVRAIKSDDNDDGEENNNEKEDAASGVVPV